MALKRIGRRERLQPWCVELSVTDKRHLDFLRSPRFFCADFKRRLFTLVSEQAHGNGDLLVALARTSERAQIMAGQHEQAGVQLALDGESAALVRQRASEAERVPQNDWQAASDAVVNKWDYFDGQGGSLLSGLTARG